MSTELERKLYQLYNSTEAQKDLATKALSDFITERENLKTTIDTAITNALSKTSQDELKKSAAQVTAAAGTLSWKFTGLCLAVLMGSALAGLGFAEWKKHELKSLQEKIDTLKKELPGLEETTKRLEGKGGRALVSGCGPQKRLCIRVSEKAGEYGKDGEDFYIIYGY